MADEIENPPERRFTTPKLIGAAVAFLGGTVLISWYLYNLELVTLPTFWVAMQYNTAVGFVLTGIAVVAHCVGRRRLAFVCGALAAGIGSVALSEQILGRQLAIVDLLFGPDDGSPQAARMAPNTALCFSLAGCLILVYGTPRSSSSRRWKEMASGMLAALLAAAGFVGLLGYVLNTGPTTGFARFTQMELHTGLGFVALGVAFFAMVGHFRDTSVERRLPAWASWAAGLGVGLLILAVWVGLTSSEDSLRSMALTRTHETALTHAHQLLQSHLRSLSQAARVFAHAAQGPREGLVRDAEAVLAEVPGLRSVLLVDRQGSLAFARGELRGEAWAAELVERLDVKSVLKRCRTSGEVTVSEATPGSGGAEALFVSLPVERAGQPWGELLCEHAVEPFFDAIFEAGISRSFDVELTSRNDVVFYRSFDQSRPSEAQGTGPAIGKVAFGDKVWTVRGAPSAWVSSRRSVSNTLILWVGVFLAVSIAFVVRKSELLRQRAAALQKANRIIKENSDSLRAANESLGEQAQNLRATEERLRRAAREKRRVLDSLSAFLIGVDGEGVVTEWNFVSSELFGLRSSETLGRRFEDLALPWDRSNVLDAITECRLSGERVARDNFTVTRRGGKDARSISFTINPTHEDGPRGFSVIGSDVTERQMLETQLHHAQKLESVGTLAAGIAHEINTPMQFVSDNVRFLSQSVGPITRLLRLVPRLLAAVRRGPDGGADEAADPELLAQVEASLGEVDVDFVGDEMPMAIDETLEGVERVTTIVRAMKDFSHPGSEGMAKADLNQAIETTLAVARNEYKYYADVETDYGDLEPVECWIADLNQVFLNLLVNATHAIRDKVGDANGSRGRIRISTRAVDGLVEVRFGDTGTGIPEEVRPKIFDQFFTTKGVGKGTGLGLAICRAVVVDKHGGTIHFETEVGVGTTFIVRIPVHQAAKDAAHEPDPVR